MRFVAITLLILAVVFRFAHLERKVYWHDEVYTSLVITARPGQYLTADLFQNRLAKPADLLAYQQFVPDLTWTDMLLRKATEDVQHPPIYYLLLRIWAQLWGTSPSVTRGFSALLSLFTFPALYWLCLELFASSLSGWIAIALFAVSPFHLVFAQEAREFGFWISLTLISSALLLRAIRLPGWRNWGLYGLSMVIAVYTSLFTLWIAIGHGIYILLMDPDNRDRWPWRIGQRTVWGGVTLVGVGVLFLPWFYLIVAARVALDSTTSWAAMSLPWRVTAETTILNFSRSFVDFNQPAAHLLTVGPAMLVLGLQAYAVYLVWRTAPGRIGWFLLTFAGITALALGLPDLLGGGQRFTVSRYLIACLVGLQLAVVYLLTSFFTASSAWKIRLSTLTFSLLIGLGILSCGTYTQANTWWNKVLNSNYHQVANLINGSDQPLIIVDAYGYNPASMVSLSYLLKPETQLLLLPSVGTTFPVIQLPPEARTIFLINLPEVFRQQFEARYDQTLTLAFQDPWNQVWRQQPR